MTPPERNAVRRLASPRYTNETAIGRYSRIMAEAECLRQSLLADAGRGDLLKTIIDGVELPSTAITQRLPARAGATNGEPGLRPNHHLYYYGALSSIRTATTLRPFAAILRDRAVRNGAR
jgi:hypothetical protein